MSVTKRLLQRCAAFVLAVINSDDCHLSDDDERTAEELLHDLSSEAQVVLRAEPSVDLAREAPMSCRHRGYFHALSTTL